MGVQPLESGQNEVFCPPFTLLLLGAQKHWWLRQRLPANLRGPPQLFQITYYLYLNSQGGERGAERQALTKKEKKKGKKKAEKESLEACIKESNTQQFLVFSTQLVEFGSGRSGGGDQ